MAKVIDEGTAKPDDDIYSTGTIIGGKRIGKLVLHKLRRDMTRDEFRQAVEKVLREVGAPVRKGAK